MQSQNFGEHKARSEEPAEFAADAEAGVLPQAQSFLNWMKLDVLPFWASHGVNEETGLYFERLDQDGSPDEFASLRLRTQFRQIYVFSHAAALGWYPPGLRQARGVWATLLPLSYKLDGQNGFIQTLTFRGEVQDPRRDSYDHAFSVLASAWLSHASGDAAVGQVLEELLHFVDAELTDGYGALSEGIPDSFPYRQNPQMHWFESMLALMETSAHPSGSQRALKHRRLFEQNLFDPKSGTLGEYFTADWRLDPGDRGEIVEPGHYMEWVWLLRRHEALGGLPASNLPSRVLISANRYLDPKHQLLVDEATRDGRTVRATRRIWLQTELIKALLAEYEAGSQELLPQIGPALERLIFHYVGRPFRQGWIDQLDAEARPIRSTVPASILYHLFVLAVELERVFVRPPQSCRSRD